MTNLPTKRQEGREDEFEIISVYTDADGIEDGFLVDLAPLTRVRFRGLPINRMTRHLFDDLAPYMEESSPYGPDAGTKLSSILHTKCQFARPSEGNTGEVGDIWRLPPDLWLVMNEVGGWTAMYPEDY